MVRCFVHRKLFTSISITGGRCWASCPFCRSRYLSSMVDASKGLLDTVAELVSRGVRGVLVSGGFTKDMALPVEKSMEDLRKCRALLKAMTIHLGLHRNPLVIEEVSRIVDVVDFELVASARDSQRLRGVEPRRYLETLERLAELRANVVPHVFLWTPWRSLSDVLAELSIVESFGFRRVTLLVLIGGGEPPRAIGEWLSRAASHFSGEIALGCMRPWSCRRWLDEYAAREGLVDAIASPHPRALDYCSELYDSCCSLPQSLLPYFEAKAYFSWGQS
ncbi:MAG: biotin synthase [Crenarchaeota archaeon]|nr:biotin synthase [Thermoproteota archaeon]